MDLEAQYNLLTEISPLSLFLCPPDYRGLSWHDKVLEGLVQQPSVLSLTYELLLRYLSKVIALMCMPLHLYNNRLSPK